MFSSISALTPPATPTISGVDYIATGQQIKITLGGVPVNADSCHAVLCTDLTTGFDVAYRTGNSVSHSGTVITFAATSAAISSNSNTLTVDIDSSFRERYYIAVSASRAIADSARVFSPWCVYTDAAGLPKAISTNSGDVPENVLYRARKIGEASENRVVVDITFSLKYADTTGSKFKLYRNNIAIVNLDSLGSITDSKKSIKEAIDSHANLDSQLVIKRDTSGFSQYTIYRMTTLNSGDSLTAEILKPDSTVDTTLRKIFITEDAAHRDIIKTITMLCRMASATADPVYPGALDTPADTNKVKFLATAMIWCRIIGHAVNPHTICIQILQGSYLQA